MSKIKVLVQMNHVVHGNDGMPMSSGFQYDVKDTELIRNYISERILSEVFEPEVIPAADPESAPKVDVKKPQPNKSPRTQETDADNPQENA